MSLNYLIMRMRKNRFLVIMLFCCINIVACQNEDISSAAYFQKGVVFYQNDEFDKARIEFKNAIQKDPEMAGSYYYLALLNEKSGKFKAMRMNLIESIKLDPENIEAKLKLSKVNLLFNENDKSLKEVEEVLTKKPDYLDALSLKASILLRQGKNEEALVIADEVLAKDAENVEAISLKTLLLMKKQAFDEALTILMPAIKKDKQNVSLYLLKIQLDSKRNDLDAVVAGYEKLVELKPENIQIKYILAKIYLKANRKQKAESLLRTVVSENPDLLESKFQLLELVYSVDKARSLSLLDEFIKENAENHSKLITFSKWLISKKENSKARDLLARVLKTEGINQEDNANSRLLLAELDFSKKDYKSSLVQVEKILNENSENLKAKLIKAKILTDEGNYNSAIEIIKSILWQDPKMDKALSLFGTINLLQGEIIKANTNYKDALKINPTNLRALDFIVNKEVKNGNVDYAIELLERALGFLPTQLAILTKLVELNIVESSWDKANEYTKVIKNKKNGVLLSKILKAKILQGQNNYKEAISLYKEILKDTPWVKQALTGLASCYEKLDKNNNEMMQYLGLFIDKNPELNYPVILKSKSLSVVGETQKAIVLLNQTLKNQLMKAADLSIELARLYNLLGNKEETFNAYKQGLSENPDNIGLLLGIAAYYERYSDYDMAVQQYRLILQLNVKQSIARNNLAVILLDQYGEIEDINEAVKLVEVFKQSERPYFLDTYGWAQLKNEDLNMALSIFKQVIILAPDVPVFRYHLAETYFRLNDFIAASSEIKQAIQIAKGKQFPEREVAEKLLEKIKNK